LEKIYLVIVGCVLCTTGCSSKEPDPVAMKSSYQTVVKADEAFAAKNFAEALPLYDQTISASLVQGDVLAEAYVKRAICRMQAGDFGGASDDLAFAEQGGAAGDDLVAAKRRLAKGK
jgi:hypothetical protein